MSHARQSRRLARSFAAMLGAAAGADAVNDFATGAEPPTAAEFRSTLRGSWDEPAINAGSARLDRCPVGHDAAYYAAYEHAARAEVTRLVSEMEAT